MSCIEMRRRARVYKGGQPEVRSVSKKKPLSSGDKLFGWNALKPQMMPPIPQAHRDRITIKK